VTDATLTFVILGAVVVLFVSNRVPVGLVAIGASLALYLTGILTANQALAGYGDPAVIFIATLFVVSEGLDATGVTTWAGQMLLAQVGDSRSRLIVLMMLLVAGLTAFISVNGAVAALLPVVVVMAVRLGRPTSQLLIPLVFAAHAGSMLTLTGTPVNVIINEAAVEYGGRPFGYVEFALVGVPLVIGAIAIVLLLGERLLPTRRAKVMPSDFSRHARTLVAQYGLSGEADEHVNRTTGLAEVVIPPRSGLVGEAAFPGMVTDSGDLVVLAIQRKGEDVGPRETTLAVGDTLLLQGSWAALDENLGDRNVLVVDDPALVRRQVVPLGERSGVAIAVLVGMVVLLATAVVPSAIAGLLAAGAMVLFGAVTVDGAYRSISWTTVVLVGGMIPLSTAMAETGAADQVATALVSVVGPLGPYALLAGLFLITAVLGQLISNMATALVVIPIAAAAALDLGLSVQPVLMSVTVAAAASFLTPVATPVNMMVMGPGGYRFGDYWKLGILMMGLFFVVSVFLVPVFWPFGRT
jgi:di/tricarboxylate transporter